MPGQATYIVEASQLPLRDAAFLLWTRRHYLDSTERDGSNDAPVLGTEDRTIERLRKAHPEAESDQLSDAVRAAGKLELDCFRHFAYSAAGLIDDARRAVERARVDNPDFSEATYTVAVDRVCFEMK
ncbi:hypothetical protein [Inquilinus sp. CA228]|uniref:hypothetical protein n=1 Tax=Inquilinus sp. CA228 TaxID=3455609 RepID=UPI003F8D5C40